MQALGCGGSPSPDAVLAQQQAVADEVKKVAGDQVVDLSGIPVKLTARVVSVEAGPGGGAPAVVATAQGNEIDVAVDNASICGPEGLTASARRISSRVELGLSGGTPCAAGPRPSFRPSGRNEGRGRIVRPRLSATVLDYRR